MSVTLTAIAASGATFVGWSGACTGQGNPCQVQMDDARSVTARFDAMTYTLSVTRTGAGDGTISLTPAGIDCGTACSATYASGTAVTLTASVSGGATFTGWSGAW